MPQTQDRAADSGRRLDGTEAEHGNVGEGVASVTRSPEGLGTILHEQQTVRPRERGDGAEVEAPTEEMRHHHCAGAGS
jgi:hypothetical protein